MYTFKLEDKHTGRTLVHETNEETLYAILEDFKYFLLGAGFHFEGDLTVMDDFPEIEE